MVALPLDDYQRSGRKRYALYGAIALVAVLITFFSTNLFSYSRIYFTPIPKESSLCPLYDPIAPKSFYKDNSTVLRSCMTRIPRLLGKDLPLVTRIWNHQNQHLRFGLFLERYDKKLKPILLTGHQDTVPVQKDSLDQWTYPPFEGHYDGEFIYGRGASDCKNVVIAILETLELLLSKGFEPKRHIIAAFGFDEESSGIISASRIGKYLERPTARIPSTLRVDHSGGHSSIPPDHTSIGIISELNYVIEKDPYRPILTEKNPILQYSQCAALHDPENNIPTFLKKSFLRAGHDRIANAILVGKILENKLTKYLIKTSQAIDIISGGEKANALPEDTKVLINHRIAVESSVDEVKAHFVTRVVEVAKRHNLSVVAYGDEVLTDIKDSGLFNVTVNSKPLNAAPVTPTNDTVWAYLSGVTRHVFEDLVFTNITYPIVTVPSILTGNTDTRHYWNLTRNIFRFTPQFANNFPSGVHSVDEKLPFSAHLQLQAWFYEYLQAIDTDKANN
ncbi:Carboxypeptidase S [Candida viswanathii]|uniref:Carboxypeptidase S n=1 Tax=Candida viswanathii TaxID=5486 RepID=A0A367XZR7_9ASCO|nr:Carboxypeptidase S [Candida viswanathii]